MPHVVPLGEDLFSLQQPFRGLWTSHLVRSFIPWFVLVEDGLVPLLSETKGMAGKHTDQLCSKSQAFFLWKQLVFLFRRIK